MILGMMKNISPKPRMMSTAAMAGDQSFLAVGVSGFGFSGVGMGKLRANILKLALLRAVSCKIVR